MNYSLDHRLASAREKELLRCTLRGITARIIRKKGNTAADKLATAIAETAKTNLPVMKLRADLTDGDIDFEEDFKIRRGTLCPCVL